MFTNTEYFSPVIKEGITKAPSNSYEYHDWYKEQVRRCTEGYSVGGQKITGRHYWYLNWWKIRAVPKDAVTKRKIMCPPRFLDVDWEFFWEFEKAVQEGQNFMVAKRRQVGATEKTMAIFGHEFTFAPASQSVVVAGEEKYANTAISYLFRSLNLLSGTEFFQQTNPIDDGVRACYKSADAGGKGWVLKGRMAEILWFTAKNNAQVVSSRSPSLILFEECGVFKWLKETFGFVQPSIEDQGKATGTAIFLGTGGDMDSGSKSFGEMFYNPGLYNIRSYENEYAEAEHNGQAAGKIAYFIPGWKYLEIDREGNSLKKESLDLIHREREKALEANDNKMLLATTIKWPVSPDEIFLILKGNRFPQAKLNRQRAQLMKHREITAKHDRVNIDFTFDGVPAPGRPMGSITGVKWDLDKDGVFQIFEFPELESDGTPKSGCFGATDSYDKDKAYSSDSKGSTGIFNGRKMKFVARVTERPELAEQFFEMSAKICMMYGAKNLIEYTNLRIFDWYEKMGLTYLLKERPDIATANMMYSQVDHKYGIDPMSKNMCLNLYRDYMEAHSEKMEDIEQITRALQWQDNDKDYNCDITMQSAYCICHYTDEQIYIPQEGEGMSKEEKVQFFYWKSKNGQLSTNFANN